MRIPMIGKRFSKLVVIDNAPKMGKDVAYLCQCDCGKTTITKGVYLRNGDTTSCGCMSSRIQSEYRKKNLIGQKFTKLTVIKCVGTNKWRNQKFLCTCDCGKSIIVPGGSLIGGTTKSCGCLWAEIMIKDNKDTLFSLPHIDDVCLKIKNREEAKGIVNVWNIKKEIAIRQFQPQCVVCGEIKDVCTDHIIPMSKGNQLDINNASRLCRHCNMIKGNKSLDELSEGWKDLILDFSIRFQEHCKDLTLD